jgi:hypothetical protein
MPSETSRELPTASVLRGPRNAQCCEVQELTATGARLKLSSPPPDAPLLLSFDLAGEPVTVPVQVAPQSSGGSVAVRFARSSERRMAGLIAARQQAWPRQSAGPLAA